MHSPLPKVLHPICGRSLLSWIIEPVLRIFPESSIGVVVGHGAGLVQEKVLDEFASEKERFTFILQGEQRGTGHAVQVAMDSEWGKQRVLDAGSIIVLPGDLPLISENLLTQLGTPLSRRESIRLVSCKMDQPFGYGRVVRRGGVGAVFGIVEEKDCTPEQRKINEVSASIYHFETKVLKAALKDIRPNNKQNEYYLTDVIEIARKKKRNTSALIWPISSDLRGINDLWELSLAQKELNLRLIEKFARAGVRFEDPCSTKIEGKITFGEGVTVGAGVHFQGNVVVGNQCRIGVRSVLNNVELESGIEIKPGCVLTDAKVGSDSVLGPYCHLRPGAVVGKKSKIGNFVELKAATVGNGTSIAHLSYVGDAKIGNNVNIGCGFVTCNYDGKQKHKTVIEDGVFMGSDCQTVAPIHVGEGAYVASGSTLTEDVPPNALAIARSRQTNKAGYAKKLKEK